MPDRPRIRSSRVRSPLGAEAKPAVHRPRPAWGTPQRESEGRPGGVDPAEIPGAGPVTDAVTDPSRQDLHELHDKVEAAPAAGLQAARERVSQLRNEVLRLRVGQNEKAGPPHSFGPDARSLETVWEVLTDRECEVLSHFIASPNDKRVASSLGTRPQTVRNQLNSISRKLGVQSRVELAILFVTAYYSGARGGVTARVLAGS